MRSSFISGKCIAGLIAGIVLTIPAAQSMAESTFVIQGSKAASQSSCVVETDDIRRNHMDYMKHGRDETVIVGDRTGKFSLSGCIDCHAAVDDSGEFVPVDDPGQFCQNCHEYVAVSPPCFQCHRTTPEKGGMKLGAVAHGQLLHQQLHASTALDVRMSVDTGASLPQTNRETDHE